MTTQEAKNTAKKTGTVEFRGVRISETRKMEGNWEQYAGKYKVFKNGEPVDETFYDSVSLSKAFEIVKPYFHKIS